MVPKIEQVIMPTKTGMRIKKVSVQNMDIQKEVFDDGFENGVFTESRNHQKPRTKLRPMLRYCEKHGKSPSQLTAEELKKFTIYP